MVAERKRKTVYCLLAAVLLTALLAAFPAAALAAPNPYHTGDTVFLGRYPQTQVTDKALLKTLNAVEAPWAAYPYSAGDGGYGSMTRREYAYYKDVTCEGETYRAVRFTKYRPAYVFDGYPKADASVQKRNGFAAGKTYWFRFDPVEWMVLEPETGLLIAKNVLDAQPFSDAVYRTEDGAGEGYGRYGETSCRYSADGAGGVPANSYADSSVRAWLNGVFYDTAFTAKQKKYITAPRGAKDKVRLLSGEETQNEAYYGEETFWGERLSILGAGATAYALSQGLDGGAEGDCLWLLGTPGENTGETESFYYYRETSLTYDTGTGVRPVINVNFGECVAGDIDGDGKTAASDARYALRVSVGLSDLPAECLVYADADGDGSVTAADARLILRYSVSLEKKDALSHFFAPKAAPTERIPYENKEYCDTKELVAGKTVRLGEKHIRRKGTSYRWTSSNPAVAKVSADGTVTALKKGYSCVYLTNGSSRYYYEILVLSPLQARIYALREKYPEGYYWNSYPKSKQYPAVSETPCSDHDSGIYSHCIGQCAGFAELLSNEIFGYDAPVRRNLKVGDIRIGDYVRCLPHHSVFVIDRVNKGEVVGYDMYGDANYTAYCDMITVAECNWDCCCGISWGRTIGLDELKIDASYSYSRY